MILGGEQRRDPLLLPVGEQIGSGMQGASGTVERIVVASAVAVELVLDPAAAAVQGVTGEADHVERVHHRGGVGQAVAGWFGSSGDNPAPTDGRTAVPTTSAIAGYPAGSPVGVRRSRRGMAATVG